MHDRIRTARVEEAGALSDLARASKAYWGYDAAFMRACDVELMVTAEDIARDIFGVFEEDGVIGGFYQLSVDGAAGELESLFVAPAYMRQGVGATLWRHMAASAQQRMLRKIRIDSDPFAEPFYLAMGAKRIGDTPSGSIPGRRLPLLEYLPPPAGTDYSDPLA